MTSASISRTKSPTGPACSPDPYTLTERAPLRSAALEKVARADERHRMIAQAAYYMAEKRAFEPGRELDDWLAAEHEINARCGLIEPHPNWDPG
jgi:hypothetical protein